MGDAISRKLVYAFLLGLISDNDERKKALEYINELPPVDLITGKERGINDKNTV